METPDHPGQIFEYNFQNGTVSLAVANDQSTNSSLHAPAKKIHGKDDHLSQQETSNIKKQEQHPIFHRRRILVPNEQDGTPIPLTLIWKHQHLTSPPIIRPAILSVYGSYGTSLPLTYSPPTRHLLDQGYIMAYAHVRGGGELGKGYWYDEGGRKERKMNSILDFVSCAKFLRDDDGWVEDEELKRVLVMHDKNSKPRRKLGAMSYSAGGVIVGSAMNLEPSLFGAVSLMNPFLDVWNTTTSSSSSSLTQHEKDEWGDPLSCSRVNELIRFYCPFRNIPTSISVDDELYKNRGYPNLLLVCALDDENVPHWHSSTFVKKVEDSMNNGEESCDKARMKRIGKDGLYLIVEESGGHEFYGRKAILETIQASFFMGHLNQ